MTKDKTINASIDWNLSIKLANDNKNLAQDLLSMFVDDLANVRKSVLSSYEDKNFPKLKNELHKLRGASCYCGVAQLTLLLQDMEELLKKSQNDPDFKHLLIAFNKEVDAILDDYKKLDFG